MALGVAGAAQHGFAVVLTDCIGMTDAPGLLVVHVEAPGAMWVGIVTAGAYAVAGTAIVAGGMMLGHCLYPFSVRAEGQGWCGN